jgi:uncharacterized membrane protein
MWAFLVVAVIAIVVAIVYFSQSRPGLGWLFVVLAVLALIGTWFATAPPRSPE